MQTHEPSSTIRMRFTAVFTVFLVVLATLAATTPPASAHHTSPITKSCADGNVVDGYHPGSECAYMKAYYESYGCSVGISDENADPHRDTLTASHCTSDPHPDPEPTPDPDPDPTPDPTEPAPDVDCPLGGTLTADEVAAGAPCVYDAQEVALTAIQIDDAVVASGGGAWEGYRRNFTWAVRAAKDIPIIDKDEKVVATIPAGHPIAAIAVGLSWVRGGSSPAVVCNVQVINVQAFSQPLSGIEQTTTWDPPPGPRVVNGNPAGTGVYPAGNTSTCGPQGDKQGGTSWVGHVQGNLKVKFSVSASAGVSAALGVELTARQFNGTVTVLNDNSAIYVPNDVYQVHLAPAGP